MQEAYTNDKFMTKEEIEIFRMTKMTFLWKSCDVLYFTKKIMRTYEKLTDQTKSTY